MSEPVVTRPPQNAGSEPGLRRASAFHILWPWITALLGLLVIILDYINDAIVYTWIEDRNLVPQINNPTDWLLGLIGLTLFIGGITSGVMQMRRR